jgi:hypothetical protein
VSWACLIGTLVLARSRTGPATSITSSRDLLSRIWRRLAHPWMTGAGFCFATAIATSGSRAETAPSATIEKPPLGVEDFRFDRIFSCDVASSLTGATPRFRSKRGRRHHARDARRRIGAGSRRIRKGFREQPSASLDHAYCSHPGVTTASQCEPRPDRRRARHRIRGNPIARQLDGGRSRPPRSFGAPSTSAETNTIARAMPIGRPGLGESDRRQDRLGPVSQPPRTSFAVADSHELHVPWDREHQLALVWLISQR